ncbi:MAG: glycerophosphodiester phosphodiesterase family protein [Myxococcota bacterium]|nr:glycerophosphodiester phosphodiesterase family protein [Myxococcota bacterium]
MSKPFPTPFEVIAHRGASAYAPENTIVAFEMARELGAVDVELDIQLSRDDVVVLYHDATLREKTGRSGKVRDHDANDLLDMDIGSWFDRTHPEIETKHAGTRLCTLAAVFEAFGDTLYYHVELKSGDEALAPLALEQVRAYRLEANVRFTSFMFEQLVRAREVAPDIPAGLLVGDAMTLRREAGAGPDVTTLSLQKKAIDHAKKAGFDQVGFASEDLSPALVRYAVESGLEIRAWRIKSDADMHRAIDMGAFGMTTNWPDRLVRELLLRKRTRPERQRKAR